MDNFWLLKPVPPRQPMPPGMNCKPWYQDKLPSKCFAKHKHRLLKFPTSLDGRRWVSVKEGLDDFRRGCPSCENLITRGPKEGFPPVASRNIPHPGSRTGRKKLPRTAELFSTLSPAQQARKAFVKDVEASLTKHPLERYTSLKEDLPADLLLEVLEVLDPDRKLEDTWAYCEDTGKRTEPHTWLWEESPPEVDLAPTELSEECPAEVDLAPTEFSEEHPARVYLSPTEFCEDYPSEIDLAVAESCEECPSEADLAPSELGEEYPAEVDQEPPKLNFLLLLESLFPKKKKKKKKRKIWMPTKKFMVELPPLRKGVPKGVHEFCKWATDFGAEGLDVKYMVNSVKIDVSKLYKPTFPKDKIKPVILMPFDVNYSRELDEIEQRRFSLQEYGWEKRVKKPRDPYKPKHVKIRYGAWYLKTWLWTKLRDDEPLVDPRILLEAEMRRRRPDIIDDLYGTIAFKDFIVSKGYRMPVILEKMFRRKGWSYDSVKTPLHRLRFKFLEEEDEPLEEAEPNLVEEEEPLVEAESNLIEDDEPGDKEESHLDVEDDSQHRVKSTLDVEDDGSLHQEKPTLDIEDDDSLLREKSNLEEDDTLHQVKSNLDVEDTGQDKPEHRVKFDIKEDQAPRKGKRKRMKGKKKTKKKKKKKKKKAVISTTPSESKLEVKEEDAQDDD